MDHALHGIPSSHLHRLRTSTDSLIDLPADSLTDLPVDNLTDLAADSLINWPTCWQPIWPTCKQPNWPTWLRLVWCYGCCLDQNPRCRLSWVIIADPAAQLLPWFKSYLILWFPVLAISGPYKHSTLFTIVVRNGSPVFIQSLLTPRSEWTVVALYTLEKSFWLLGFKFWLSLCGTQTVLQVMGRGSQAW